MKDLKDKFDQLVGRDDLKGALEVLNQAAPDRSNEVILTQARLSGLEQNVRLGIISNSDAQINRNQIAAAIMSIAGDVFRGIVSTGNGGQNTGTDATGLSNQQSDGNSSEKKIYISYSWKDNETDKGKNRERLVNRVCKSLENAGYTIMRDKKNVDFGDSISQFMKDLGENELCLLFLSEKYFQSYYTMFEVCEIARNANWEKEKFRTKVLPFMVEDDLFPRDRSKLKTYATYWREQAKSIQEDVVFFGEQADENLVKESRNTKKIKDEIVKLYGWLKDINASKPKLLSGNDFEKVKDVIDNRLGL